jgi:hypothetical protein
MKRIGGKGTDQRVGSFPKKNTADINATATANGGRKSN